MTWHPLGMLRQDRPEKRWWGQRHGVVELLTVANITGHIGVHEQTVRLWKGRGELKASTFGTRISYRIRRADYEAFLARRSTPRDA